MARTTAVAARRILIAAMLSAGMAAGADGVTVRTTSHQPPRKVIVGTVLQSLWGEYPGLDRRLSQLATLVDQLAAESKRKYGRGLDLAVLPEEAVTGGMKGDFVAHSAQFRGAVQDVFARKAREHHCYIVVPMYLLEDEVKRIVYNVAILVGRNGETVGMYRKLHLATPSDSDLMESGVTPGKEVPVFQCDFGKLGIQICFDMSHDYGWNELVRAGADLVVWPTQSPQTCEPAFRARQSRLYIVSSAWRENASIFEPTGRIMAQIRDPQHVLVQELDLSYALLPWSKELANGEALKKVYGERVGFRYYPDEDGGIFWSNDPRLPIGRMIQALHITEMEDELLRIRKLYHKAGIPGS